MKRSWLLALTAVVVLAGCGSGVGLPDGDSSGLAGNQVVVPDVVGLSGDEALRAMTDVDLDLRTRDDATGRIVGRLARWVVIEQDPKAGQRVESGLMVNARVVRVDPPADRAGV